MYYRIDLELFKGNRIEIEDYNTRKTKKAAQALAKRLSKSKKAKELEKQCEDKEDNVRVWMEQCWEEHDEDYGSGRLTEMYRNGECIYSTVG